MRSLIIAALVAIPALGAAASADEGRMNRLQFERATQCLAYANLAVLREDRPDTAALEAQVAREYGFRPANTRNEVRDSTREIRMSGASNASPARVQRLKAERARVCGQFLGASTEAKN